MGAVSTSPLREGLRLRRMPDPCAVVIFGATGDLTHRKLMPALYTLARLGMIRPTLAVVGVARRPKTDEAFRNEMAEAVLGSSPVRDLSLWQAFAQGLYYVQAEFHDPQGYERLRETLDRVDRERGTGGNRLYYLATAPEYYVEIVQNLERHGLTERPGGGARAGVRGSGWWSRSPSAATCAAPSPSTARSCGCSARTRSTASTTTWARRPSRTSWCSGSPTASSSLCGTSTTSTTCRSRWPRAWGSRSGPATTRPPASCGISSRTT